MPHGHPVGYRLGPQNTSGRRNSPTHPPLPLHTYQGKTTPVLLTTHIRTLPHPNPLQDISDEMRQVIHAMRGHDDKVRVVLNKADQVGAMRADSLRPVCQLPVPRHHPASCMNIGQQANAL